MAAGLSAQGRAAARSCGCRPRKCSSRESSRCRWPGACGSARSRRISGGGAGGRAARPRWRSREPGGAACRLDERQLARLRAALDAGPAASGWDEGQRWTLARVTALIARLFHVRYTLRGTSDLLHRMGFSPQVPVHRATERDEAAIAEWRAGTWAKVRG
jgi:transposase